MASIVPYKSGWRAFVRINGKRKTKTFDLKRDASAWAAAEEAAAADLQGKPEAELHTLRDMLERYSKEVSTTKKGARSEQLRITAFLRNFPTLGDKTLASIRTADLADWRDQRLGGFNAPDGKRVGAVSAAAVLRDLSWMSNAFTVARDEWGWLEHKPFDGLRPPPAPPPRTRRVFPKEVKKICRRLYHVTGKAPETKQQEVALAFLVGLRSGMRAGEILSLGKGNLDLTRRVATVEHKTQHLTGLPRSVPLTRQAVRLLRPVAGRERCFSVSSGVLDTLFRKARDQCLIEDLHFHDSRAEALTRLSRKVDVMTLAKISGHKDLSILQNTYYRETAEDIAARI
ncbi:tyrosine-type recombinase/integrase [Burkholderia sp. FERM BP-3421]|uniref:tyrosine-type recombinase/integrase n=1 Tax=Burkholderia sp. FERM BP-3421 TaxID=1494466 RepID=UPI0023611C9B|nr:tyrosine-type recombinase/integrase [Burkholderia sp. FERM BP-3421]WDD93857.1 tyrosine-type recombinase/integrase [Burkholderia sp. FERM BP-3421]